MDVKLKFALKIHRQKLAHASSLRNQYGQIYKAYAKKKKKLITKHRQTKCKV